MHISVFRNLPYFLRITVPGSYFSILWYKAFSKLFFLLVQLKIHFLRIAFTDGSHAIITGLSVTCVPLSPFDPSDGGGVWGVRRSDGASGEGRAGEEM